MPNLATVKARTQAADAAQGTGGLLTSKVDAAVKGLMRNKLNPNQQWQVVLPVDRSGSMGYSYPNEVQDAIDRTLAFAALVDDDGSVPVIFFDSQLQEITVKLDNFYGLVARERISARGSTDLTSALKRVAEITGNGDLFASGGWGRRAPKPAPRKMNVPAFVPIITDGAPNDRESARDAVQRLSFRGIELKFIYVGHDESGWRFLQSLDDDIPVGVPYEQGGRLFDNVDAKRFDSLASAGDDAFYDAMFDEVPGALAAMRQHGLI